MSSKKGARSKIVKLYLPEVDYERIIKCTEKTVKNISSTILDILKQTILSDDESNNDYNVVISYGKKGFRIYIYCNEEDYKYFIEKSNEVKLSTSEYILRAAKNAKIESIYDKEVQRESMNLRGDMNRIGGLLKMMLSREDMFQGMYGIKLQHAAKDLLDRLNDSVNIINKEVLEKLKNKKL